MLRKTFRNNNTNNYCNDERGNIKHKHKVLFKTPVHGKYRGYDRTQIQMALQNHLNNDVPMNKCYNGHSRRRNVCFYNTRRENSSIISNNKRTSNITWFKVIIPFGHKYTKEFILKSILDLINPHTFIPIMYKVTERESEFYLDSEEDANYIQECNQKIICNNGYKLKIIVKPGYPNIEAEDLTETLKNKIKLVLSKRYLAANNALDLTCFHRDPELITDYFCALFRPLIMSTVLKIIAENIPNVIAINFNDNKLTDFRSLKSLKDQLKNLKILYIGNNKLKYMNQLDILKGIELEELVLQGNPICNRFKLRMTDYVAEIQKRFPKLKQLDFKEVTQPISFDLEEESKSLPLSRMLFVINEEAKNIVVNFLMEYFQVFDSVNRQNLINAYHEQASFSISISYMPSVNKLHNYATYNRNLLKINDPIKRHKLLTTGRIHIMTQIVALPKTKHIEQSFTMDVCYFTKEMIMVVVTGNFRELTDKKEPLRYFNRTLVIVPEGNGFCICNEQLHITHATNAQEKKFGSLGTTQTLPTQVPTTSTVSQISIVPPTPTTLLNENMQQMALTFSQQTNMNIFWSIKCLQEYNWNYNNALNAFETCLKNGQIPAEAFNK